jgi:single-strand DNA-binding protein
VSSVNKAIILGHLGADPEVKTAQSGAKMAMLSVATSTRWRDKATGERREHTEWHRVVVFNERLIDGPVKYLKKGSKAYVEGEMRTRKWTAQDGSDRFTTEVVLTGFHSSIQLLDRADRAPEPTDVTAQAATDAGAAPMARPPRGQDLDDEIPF